MSDKSRIEWTDATWNPVTGGIALPSGVSWRCRCGIRWRLDDDIWTQLAPKGRP